MSQSIHFRKISCNAVKSTKILVRRNFNIIQVFKLIELLYFTFLTHETSWNLFSVLGVASDPHGTRRGKEWFVDFLRKQKNSQKCQDDVNLHDFLDYSGRPDSLNHLSNAEKEKFNKLSN